MARRSRLLCPPLTHWTFTTSPARPTGPTILLNIPNMGINMPILGTKAKIRVSKVQRRTSLADALFSTIQQRVLAYLFGQPERSFFATELIKLAGGSGAVQRELAGWRTVGW